MASPSPWSEIADFLSDEDDAEGMELLRQRTLESKPQDVELLRKILAFYLRKGDRKVLISVVKDFASANRCLVQRNPKMSAYCQTLEEIWLDNLDSVFFHNESDRKLENARRMIEGQDCPGALGVLKEIESKEGASKKLLLMQKRAFDCLKDVESSAAVSQRVGEMRIFSRDDEH